jgi:Uri superfamily endonuclease
MARMNIESGITAQPGTYALILRALAAQDIQVGRLGRLAVLPGVYVYVGSAFGPGGLMARVGRHQRKPPALHWHIDYLRRVTELVEVWFTYDPIPREHEWADIFRNLPGAMIPLKGFGASDCRCKAHLFYFETEPSEDKLEMALLRQGVIPSRYA